MVSMTLAIPKELKKEIGKLIKNFESNYKTNLEQAALQPRQDIQHYTQSVAQLIEATEKSLKKIKEKRAELATITSKLSDERHKKEDWGKQHEEYNNILKKLEPLENLLQQLKR